MQLIWLPSKNSGMDEIWWGHRERLWGNSGPPSGITREGRNAPPWWWGNGADFNLDIVSHKSEHFLQWGSGIWSLHSPSVHPSIVLPSIWVQVTGRQELAKSPDFLLPSHLDQLLWEIPKAFPGQPRDTWSLQCILGLPLCLPLAACIRNLVCLVTTQTSWPPVRVGTWIGKDLLFSLALISPKQASNIIASLPNLPPHWEAYATLFQVKTMVLALEELIFHPDCFTLGFLMAWPRGLEEEIAL